MYIKMQQVNLDDDFGDAKNLSEIDQINRSIKDLIIEINDILEEIREEMYTIIQ